LNIVIVNFFPRDAHSAKCGFASVSCLSICLFLCNVPWPYWLGYLESKYMVN